MKGEHGHKQLEYRVNKRWTGFIKQKFLSNPDCCRHSDFRPMWRPGHQSLTSICWLLVCGGAYFCAISFELFWWKIFLTLCLHACNHEWLQREVVNLSLPERTYDICVKLTVLSRFLEVSSAAYTSPRLTPQQEPSVTHAPPKHHQSHKPFTKKWTANQPNKNCDMPDHFNQEFCERGGQHHWSKSPHIAK